MSVVHIFALYNVFFNCILLNNIIVYIINRRLYLFLTASLQWIFSLVKRVTVGQVTILLHAKTQPFNIFSYRQIGICHAVLCEFTGIIRIDMQTDVAPFSFSIMPQMFP